MQKSLKTVKPLSEKKWRELTQTQRMEIAEILEHADSVRDVNKEFIDHRTIGQIASDGVARVAGSWSFILTFLASLLVWAFINTEILGPRHEAFDPYPYVFLNLILSIIAAAQGPIIMMSQNRQGSRDRLDAEIDHEVNLRAEIAIQVLDEKIQLIGLKLDALSQPVITPLHDNNR